MIPPPLKLMLTQIKKKSAPATTRFRHHFNTTFHKAELVLDLEMVRFPFSSWAFCFLWFLDVFGSYALHRKKTGTSVTFVCSSSTPTPVEQLGSNWNFCMSTLEDSKTQRLAINWKVPFHMSLITGGGTTVEKTWRVPHSWRLEVPKVHQSFLFRNFRTQNPACNWHSKPKWVKKIQTFATQLPKSSRTFSRFRPRKPWVSALVHQLQVFLVDVHRFLCKAGQAQPCDLRLGYSRCLGVVENDPNWLDFHTKCADSLKKKKLWNWLKKPETAEFAVEVVHHRSWVLVQATRSWMNFTRKLLCAVLKCWPARYSTILTPIRDLERKKLQMTLRRMKINDLQQIYGVKTSDRNLEYILLGLIFDVMMF